MKIEALVQSFQSIKSKKFPVKEKIKNQLETIAAPSLFRIEMSRETLNQIAYLIAQDHPVIIAANHQSHADIIPMAIVANRIRKKANRLIKTKRYPRKKILDFFYLPTAVSVSNQTQGGEISDLYSKYRPWLKTKHVIIKYVTRDRDQNVYQAGDQKQTLTFRDTADLLRAFKNGCGIVVAVSGTVQEGRRINPESDERFGMKEFRAGKNLLSEIIFKQSQKGLPPVLVFMGISDSYNIVDPDTRKVTEKAKKAAKRNLLSRHHPQHLATTIVERPFISNIPQNVIDNPTDDDHQKLINSALKRISLLIPEYQRGDFRKN